MWLPLSPTELIKMTKCLRNPNLGHFQMHFCSVAQNQNCINHLGFISFFFSPSISSSLINIVDPISRITRFFSPLAENPVLASSHTWNTDPALPGSSMTWPLHTSLSSLYTAVTLLRIFQPQWPFSFSNTLLIFMPVPLYWLFTLPEWSITRFLHD